MRYFVGQIKNESIFTRYMPRIELAVIFLNLSENNSDLLLQRPVAGVKLFDRLILTLNRSGLGKIIRKVVASVPCDQNRTDGLFFVPADRLNLINQYIQMQVMEDPLETIQSEENHNFCVSVHNVSAVRATEKSLLKQQKLNYSQLMDVWFNSLFSVRISSWLVKTPLTPNQLTLLGLTLGVLAGLVFCTRRLYQWYSWWTGIGILWHLGLLRRRCSTPQVYGIRLWGIS